MILKNLLKDNIVSYGDLTKFLPDVSKNASDYKKIIEQYPMSITKYYLSLVDVNDKNDPIRKMCVPSISESDMLGEFDTSGEYDNTIISGLQHKYKHTALILSANSCAMYCRYCFRKRMVGLNEYEVLKNFDAVFEYINSHKEINNVLISGGDSFLNNNDIILKYLSNLTNIKHLDFIRFGTKTPVVIPQRISEDKKLLSILEFYNTKKPIYIITQFNHPKEITSESIKAVKALQKIGITVKNQSVLLKDVNDEPAILSELLQKLTKLSIIPYYIFQCRPVKGVKTQFQIPLKKSYEIIEKAKALQNGQGKCFKYVLSNKRGKIEILGINSNDEMVFKYHEAKDDSKQGEIFTKKLSEDIFWID